MSHLAELIYDVLRRVAANSTWPLITYQQVLDQLPKSFQRLSPREPALHDALNEIAVACQQHHPPLPVLTAIVVSSSASEPGRRYFESVHPYFQKNAEMDDEWLISEARTNAWRAEISKAAGTRYPARLSCPPDGH